jgi:Ran GTPase-activating protein (RanGAP) involved in mRNA processing and transport
MQLGTECALFLSRQMLTDFRDRVKHLDLSNNNLRDRGAQILALSLGSDNKTLVSLNLASNCITHEGASAIFNALAQNESVIHINLSSDVESNQHNKLGPQGASDLAKLL